MATPSGRSAHREETNTGTRANADRRAVSVHRMGFESHLPLHLFNELRRTQQLLPLHYTPLSRKDAVFKLLCRFGPSGETGLRINIQRHPDPMTALVGCYFRINTRLVS